MSRYIAGLLAHVRPVFMLPVVATSICGALLAPSVSASIAAQHAGAVATTLFVASVLTVTAAIRVLRTDDAP